jgi:hypothetical protein
MWSDICIVTLLVEVIRWPVKNVNAVKSSPLLCKRAVMINIKEFVEELRVLVLCL